MTLEEMFGGTTEKIELRDMFASIVLRELVADVLDDRNTNIPNADIARIAYNVADEMMKARGPK